jgi:hypothetical protein
MLTIRSGVWMHFINWVHLLAADRHSPVEDYSLISDFEKIANFFDSTTRANIIANLAHIPGARNQRSFEDYRTFIDVNAHFLYIANFFVSVAQAGTIATIGSLLVAVANVSSIAKLSTRIVRTSLVALVTILMCLATATLVYSEVTYLEYKKLPLPQKPRKSDFGPDVVEGRWAFWDAEDEWQTEIEKPLPFQFGVATMDAVFDIVFLFAALMVIGLSFIDRRKTSAEVPTVSQSVSVPFPLPT